MTAVAPAPTAEPTTSVAPAAPARLAAVLAMLVAAVGSVLGPTGGLDPLFGLQGVAVADGVVEQRVGEDWEVVPVGTQVADGAVLRAPDGIATLQASGGSVDLGEGTVVEVAEDLRLRSGTVVVDGGGPGVAGVGVTATGDGTWRFDATGRIGAYGGSVVVADATGRDRLVRSLQQVAVRDAVVTEVPRPYAYAADDVFDRRHMADAIGVDTYLAALRDGLAAEYGTAPQPPAFYTDFDGLDGRLVAALGDVGFDRVGERVGPPADVLVAAVVTDALVTDAGLEPVPAADEVRALRLAGAGWGLVAQGRDLDAGNVRAAAERALGRRALAEQQGVATPVVAAARGTDTGDASQPTAPGTATPPDDGGGTTPDRDDGGETPSPEPDDEPGPLGSVVEETGTTELLGDDVGGLVDDVVGAVDDVLDGPEQDDTSSGTSGVGELLDTTGDAVHDTVDGLEGTVGGLLGN